MSDSQTAVPASTAKNILAFVDAPDPDNFVMLVALCRLNPGARILVSLTGRPVKFKAAKEDPLWDWDLASSRMAQEASAMRMKNFLRHFDIKDVPVYDGGIAPRTLVPHHIHFAEYYKFLDVDPLLAIRHSELEPQEQLARALMASEPGSWSVAVGGPMTGLAQLLTRCPEVADRISEVHAMYATWGNVQLMDLGAGPRGAMQFNVACDPVAAHQVLMGLDCPIYLMPTEVTRVKEIAWDNAQGLREFMPENAGTKALYHLYALWYDAAVRPRQLKNPDERIFIHDLVAAFSLDKALRESIYKIAPVAIESVPFLFRNKADWGKVTMKISQTPDTHFAATGLTDGGAEAYLKALKQVLS